MSKTLVTHDTRGGIPVSPSLTTEFADEELLAEDQPVSKRVFFLSLQAIINAVVIGLMAKVLVMLISLFTNLAFYQTFSFEEVSPAAHSLGMLVIVVPIIGGLIVGIMARYGSAAIRGHGIPEAMEQVLVNESRIKPAITFLKPLSAAISIGTGGPFGAEGPIIATGGAFGSLMGQIRRVTANERKVLLAAGATAGMSAIFGTPVAAVLLAIELLLFEFSPRSIIPVALACVTGSAMHYAIFGTEPVFPMLTIPEPDGMAMVAYVILGALIGVAASLVSKAVYAVEDLFEHLSIHWMWWPAIGAIAVGVVGYFAPLTLGVGYSNITYMLSGNVPVAIMLSLCLLKFTSWVISLGSGTSGGTLAPLLTIGGALGGLLGLATLSMIPGSNINIATCVLIGMAAMFAGASRALLTSVVFALETTMQPHGLLPLLGACTASYFVSFFLMKGSIMTEKIERRGVFAPNSFEPDILQKVNVKQVYSEDVNVLLNTNTLKQVREWIKERATEGEPAMAFIIVNEHGGLTGIAQRVDIFNKTLPDDMLVEELARKSAPHVYPENRLSLAVDMMDKYTCDILPVVKHGAAKKVLGVLTHKEIFMAYRLRRDENELYKRTISIKRSGIKIILRGRQFLNRD